MSSRQIAQLALGITGIWALIYALSGFMGLASLLAFQGREALGAALLGVGPAAALFLVGYLLVFHNAPAARLIFPDFSDDDGLPSTEVSRLLVGLTGILVVGSAIPSLVSGVLGFAVAARLTGGGPRPSLVQGLMGRLVQTAFGVFLIMQPQLVLDFLNRPPRESPEPPAAETTPSST
jgi:hypothetical protein